jgi:uncharacterized protein (DUF1800 family)
MRWIGQFSFALGCAGVAGLLQVGALAARPSAALSQGDLRWLERVTYGIDSSTLERFKALGREKFLDEALRPTSTDRLPTARATPDSPTINQPIVERIAAMRAEQQRINTLGSEDEKQAARTKLNQAANDALYQTARRHLVRALQSPSQLREQLTWFWMNHFSVFSGKANARWTLADYEDGIRQHALGRFSDLVMASLTSPAMLEYLDNAQSAAGRVNENYARELMELHTLGVSGGPSGSSYTQSDVQELARVLTGVGLNLNGTAPRLSPALQRFYRRENLFEFNPARHDTGSKILLGHRISGEGFGEVEDAVQLLCRQPATARFISRKLATYFVSDSPPPPLVDRMARVFQQTDGSVAAVVRAMFLDKDFAAALGRGDRATEKFKDPMQFVISSLRLAYDGRAILNYRPVIGWLQQLGEPLYGRVTPDGYPLTTTAWSSPGQMVRRFEIARAIGGGGAGLFNNDDNTPGPISGFPRIASRVFFEAIEPRLSASTGAVLDRARSQQEWNMLLLASPDWMER